MPTVLDFCLCRSFNCTCTCYSAKQVKCVMPANMKLLLIYHLLWKELLTAFMIYGHTHAHVCILMTDVFKNLLKNMDMSSRKCKDINKHKFLYMIASSFSPKTHTGTPALRSTVQPLPTFITNNLNCHLLSCSNAKHKHTLSHFISFSPWLLEVVVLAPLGRYKNLRWKTLYIPGWIVTEWDWSSEKLFQSRYTVHLNTKEPIKSSLTTFSAPKILKLSEAVHFLSMRAHTQLFTAAVPTTLASSECRRWIKEWKEERRLKQIPLLHTESQGESLWLYHSLSRILLQLLWGWLAMGGVHNRRKAISLSFLLSFNKQLLWWKRTDGSVAGWNACLGEPGPHDTTPHRSPGKGNTKDYLPGARLTPHYYWTP